MQPTISQLYNGDLYPHSKFKPVLEQYAKKRIEASKNYEAFYRKLPDELKAGFEQVVDGEICLLPDVMEQNFIEGFRIGVRLMIDVFLDASAAQGTGEQNG